jgi:outer membrane protein assembly factor BamB
LEKVMKGSVTVFCLILFVLTGAVLADSGAEIIASSGLKGGLVVHLGCGDGRLTAELRANERFIVHGLDTDVANIAKAQKYLHSKGQYGPVSVRLFDGKNLPYVDNMVNLLVAEDMGDVSIEEIIRVLAPKGGAYISELGKWRLIEKPWPEAIDEWTHYLHDPSNNAVAQDTIVAPPKGLQWLNGPLWSRSHGPLSTTACMVSAKGRVFTIEDLAPIEFPKLPGKYSLVARDAFNGIELWKQPLENWEAVYHHMKPTPVQLPRRLIAVGDRVYATLGIFAPVTELDAVTGRILRVFKGTEETQEIICAGGVLYLVTGDVMNPYPTDGKSGPYYRDTEAIYGLENYSPQRLKKENPQTTLLAIDLGTGRKIWEVSAKEAQGYQGTTLAVLGERLVYRTAERVVCMDRTNGRKLWSKAYKVQMSKGKLGGASPTLVVCDRVILTADNKYLIAISAEDGRELWRTDTTATYHSSPDIFVVDQTVWPYPSTNGHNILTGDVVGTRRITRDGPMGHDRCYRNKATVNYMINSRSGGADYSKFGEDYSLVSPWVRGTCGIGIMPCNGLLYASPHACSCSHVASLLGFKVLNDRTYGDNPEHPLEKGIAYNKIGNRKSNLENPADWPTYRKNAGRTGVGKTDVGLDIKELWKTKIPNPTAMSLAGGNLFVADKEAHTLYCLDSSNGSKNWEFTAGGRIDSPPTCEGGRVFFGSADGWVYCLTADKGQLVWKFRGAPEERVICSFEQIESLWPLHGSVLVHDRTVYFVAGRCSFINGGMYMFGLDAETGRIKYKHHLSGPYTPQGEPQFDMVRYKTIKGNMRDILVCDGQYIYLRHMAFDLNLKPVTEEKYHLMTVSGFLDDSKHHRSSWSVAEDLYYDTTIGARPDGDLLLLEGKRIIGVRGYPSGRTPSNWDPRDRGFTLFSMIDKGETKQKSTQKRIIDKKGNKKAAPKEALKYVEQWNTGVGVNCMAMVKARDILFIAGKPNKFPEEDLYKAVEGKMGGLIVAASAKDGASLKTFKLDSPPVWDGLIAANNCLYISTRDGNVACWGK